MAASHPDAAAQTLTIAFRLPALSLPGRTRLAPFVLAGSLVLAVAAGAGIDHTIEAYRGAQRAADAAMATSQWALLLARLETRVGIPTGDPSGEVNRFQRSAAALRKDWPGAPAPDDGVDLALAVTNRDE